MLRGFLVLIIDSQRLCKVSQRLRIVAGILQKPCKGNVGLAGALELFLHLPVTEDRSRSRDERDCA